MAWECNVFQNQGIKCFAISVAYVNSLVQGIIRYYKLFREGDVTGKEMFSISLKNINLSYLSGRVDLCAAIFLRRGSMECFLEKIPLKHNPGTCSVRMDFAGREDEFAEGIWNVERIVVSEMDEVMFHYEICRSVVVNWCGGDCYEWDVDNDWGGIGDGSKKHPYEVCSPRMLDRVRNYVNKSGVCFRQMCDIQLAGVLKIRYNKATQGFIPEPGGYLGNGEGWLPIGLYADTEEDYSFQGCYDGGGFKVDGLYINRPNCDVQGLFGIVEGKSRHLPACLLDIHIGNNSVIVGQSYLGGVVGNAGWALIRDCTNAGQINGTKSVGGIVGAAIHAEISDCYNSGYVIGVRDWDEVVGRNAGSCKGK